MSMGLYIKGIEMPKNCYECYFCTYGYCVNLNRYVENSQERDSDCPIIELPSHGDLIDRDALIKSLDKLCNRVCQYSKAQRKVMCGACPLGDAFTVIEDDAPIILEAEEGKT